MRETLLMRQRRRHVRGTRTRGAPGCATASAGDDEARELPRSAWLCVHALAQRATDRVGPRGRAGPGPIKIRYVVLCICYLVLPILFSAEQAQQTLENISR